MTASLPVSETPRLVTIDEIVHVLSHRPTATTRARDWAGVTVDMYAPLPNISERYPALDHHLICYCPTETRASFRAATEKSTKVSFRRAFRC